MLQNGTVSAGPANTAVIAKLVSCKRRLKGRELARRALCSDATLFASRTHEDL